MAPSRWDSGLSITSVVRSSLLFVFLSCATVLFGQSPQEWRDSVSSLIIQIREHPDNLDLRLLKAEGNINLQQWQYAVEEYGDVLRRDADNLAALYFRAFCYTQQRQYGMARADYEHFLALQPLHLQARLGLAHVLQKMGRQKETIDLLNHIVQMFPDSADAYAARAVYESEQQHYEPALYDWGEAVRLCPDNLGFTISQVDILLRLSRRREARQVLDAAVARGASRSQLREWYDRCK